MAGLTASVRPDSFSLRRGDDALKPSRSFSFSVSSQLIQSLVGEEDISTHECAPFWWG